MSDDTTTLQDVEEQNDEQDSQPEERETPAIVPPESAPPIQPAASPAITPMPRGNAPAVPAAMEAPAIAGPVPGTPAAAPINPAVAPAAPAGAPARLNPNSIAAQNPFNVLLAKEENIHNPFARVLAKVATHVGKGLETFAPDYQQTVAARERAAEEPSIVAQREAQTKDLQEQAQQRAAEAARAAGGQLPIEKPIPIYAATGTPNAGEQIGEEGYDKYGHFHQNMFPTAEGSAAAPPAGPGQAATPATSGGGANSAPAGPTSAAGSLPARTATTMKPQEPQRAPLATPAEAAKLAPVGTEADRYNKEIAGVLGKEAGDYKVAPTDSAEKAEKTLADARARANEIAKDKSNERAANAPIAAEQRKDAHLMGYAVDANGQLSYMSKADADKIHSTFEEVKASDVNKDRQAIRQLNDVQQNVSRYRAAQNAMKENIPTLAADQMAQILSDKAIGAKLEAFGVGIETGQVNDVLTQLNKAKVWNNLTDAQQNLVTSYLRAKSSVIAYQKALTGIGRTNKEQLDIEMEQLPAPYVGATLANKQLDAFQENIDRATEGFPTNLPGLKSPAQVRKENEKGPEAPKAFKVPDGAPPAKGVPDGKVLKQGGKVVAVARGGAWVSP